MLRFEVYDEAGPAADWPLVNAHLRGPGDLATPGQVSFDDGCITCRKRAAHTVGLSLLHDAGPMGRLMLQTCLLPDRRRPYRLTVELARHRIKSFIAKSEEWQLFDLGQDHPAITRWQEARALFSQALCTADPLEADRIARESLLAALEAGEHLAMAHADLLLHWRFQSRPASSTTLGVRLEPHRDSPALRNVLSRDFDIVVIPLRWRDVEVEEGHYRWEPIDRWLAWARDEGKPVILGPLLDFSRRALPQWIYVWQHDYSTCRDLVYEFVERVVGRYRSLVGFWNVASGLNTNENFQFTIEQMIDLTRMANLIARQARKGARTMVELRQPFGEHVAAARDSVAPLAFIDRVVQEGVRIDGAGVQLLFGQQAGGHAARDLMQISDLLDRLIVLDMPVIVSALGVPDQTVDDDGGWWHERWSPRVQSRWMSRVFPMAMSKPFVETVVWSDLYDNDRSALAGAGLVSAEGRPKPVLGRLVATRKRLRKPLGPREPQRAPTGHG